MALFEHDIEGLRTGLTSQGKALRNLTGGLSMGAFGLSPVKNKDNLKDLKHMKTFAEKDFRLQKSTNMFTQRSFNIEKKYFTKAEKFIEEERKRAKATHKVEIKFYEEEKRHTKVHLAHMRSTEKYQQNVLKIIYHQEKLMTKMVDFLDDIQENTQTLQNQARLRALTTAAGLPLQALSLLRSGRGGALSSTNQRQLDQMQQTLNSILMGGGGRRGGRASQTGSGYIPPEYRTASPSYTDLRSSAQGDLRSRLNPFMSRSAREASRDAREDLEALRLLERRRITPDQIADMRSQGYSLSEIASNRKLDNRNFGQRVGSGLRSVATAPLHPIRAGRGLIRGAGIAGRGIGMAATGLARMAPGLGAVVGGGLAAKSFSEGDYFTGTTRAIGAAASLIPGVGPLVGLGLEAVAEMIPDAFKDSFNKLSGPIFKKMWKSISGSDFVRIGGELAADFGKVMSTLWNITKAVLGNKELWTMLGSIGTFIIAPLGATIKLIGGFFDVVSDVMDGKNMFAAIKDRILPILENYTKLMADLLMSYTKAAWELAKKGWAAWSKAVDITGPQEKYNISQRNAEYEEAEHQLKLARYRQRDKLTMLQKAQEEYDKAVTTGNTRRLTIAKNVLDRDVNEYVKASEALQEKTKLFDRLRKTVGEGNNKDYDALYNSKFVKLIENLENKFQEAQKSGKLDNIKNFVVETGKAIETVKNDELVAAKDKQVFLDKLCQMQAEAFKSEEELHKKEEELRKKEKEAANAEKQQMDELNRLKDAFFNKINALFKVGGVHANFGDLILGKSGLLGLGAGLASKLGGLTGGAEGLPGMAGGALGMLGQLGNVFGLAGSAPSGTQAGTAAAGAAGQAMHQIQQSASTMPTPTGAPGTGRTGDNWATDAKFIIPVSGKLSSGFGPRNTGIPGASTNHMGQDIAAAQGTSVKAAMSGKVFFAGTQGGYGNLVILAHPGGMSTRYGHLSSTSVKVGDTVNAGDVIGAVGMTGTASGPHLHFEIRKNGQPIDPAPYMKGIAIAKGEAGNDTTVKTSQGPSTAATAKVGGPTSGASSLAQGIGQAESGGDYNIVFGAKPGENRYGNLGNKSLNEIMSLQASLPKGQGAIGKYQFMPSTLKDLVARSGMDPNTTKFTPETQDKLYSMFENDIRGQLSKKGITDFSPGVMYAAHHLGAGGAAAVMKADPNVTVQQALESAGFSANIKNNPHLATIKAGDFVQWAAGRVGGKGGSTTASSSGPSGPMDIMGNIKDLMQQAMSGLADLPNLAKSLTSGLGTKEIGETLAKGYTDAKASLKGTPFAGLADVTGAMAGDAFRINAGLQASIANMDQSPYPGGDKLEQTMTRLNDGIQQLVTKEDPIRNVLHGAERDPMVERYFRPFMS